MKNLLIITAVLSCFLFNRAEAQGHVVSSAKKAPYHLGETILMYAAADNDVRTIETLCTTPDVNLSNIAAIKTKYGQELIDKDAKIRALIKKNVEGMDTFKAMPSETAKKMKLQLRIRTYIKIMLEDNDISAIVVAINYNNVEALNEILKNLKNNTNKDSFIEYINKGNVSSKNFLQYSIGCYYKNEFKPEKNIEIIKLLLAYGSTPKGNPIEMADPSSGENRAVDIVTLAVMENNPPAINYFRSYYTSLSQSEDISTFFFVTSNAGDVQEVVNNVKSAKKIAEVRSNLETIEAISKWVDMLNGKCVDGGYVSNTSFVKIFDGDDFLAMFKVSYNVEIKTKRICDVQVSEAEKISVKGKYSVEKIQMYSEILHKYNPGPSLGYTARSHREVYILPAWTITKAEINTSITNYGYFSSSDKDVLAGKGVLAIRVGEDPYKSYVKIIDSEPADDCLRF